MGGPRLAELRQGRFIMQQVPSGHCPHCSCSLLRALALYCLPQPGLLSQNAEPGSGWWGWAAGKDWSEAEGIRPPCSQPGPGLPLWHPAPHWLPSS